MVRVGAKASVSGGGRDGLAVDGVLRGMSEYREM